MSKTDVRFILSIEIERLSIQDQHLVLRKRELLAPYRNLAWDAAILEAWSSPSDLSHDEFNRIIADVTHGLYILNQ